MTDATPKLYVTGDEGPEAYIYMNSLSETPPNLREAWVDATKLDCVRLQGGAGLVVALLDDLGVEADAVPGSDLRRTDRFSAYHLPPNEVLQLHTNTEPPKPCDGGQECIVKLRGKKQEKKKP